MRSGRSDAPDWPHPGIAAAGHAGHHRAMTRHRRRLSRPGPAAIAVSLALLLASTTAARRRRFPEASLATIPTLRSPRRPSRRDAKPSIGPGSHGKAPGSRALGDDDSDNSHDEPEPRSLRRWHHAASPGRRDDAEDHALSSTLGSEPASPTSSTSAISTSSSRQPRGAEYDSVSCRFRTGAKRQPTPGTAPRHRPQPATTATSGAGAGRTSSNPAPSRSGGPNPGRRQMSALSSTSCRRVVVGASRSNAYHVPRTGDSLLAVRLRLPKPAGRHDLAGRPRARERGRAMSASNGSQPSMRATLLTSGRRGLATCIPHLHFTLRCRPGRLDDR